ncbi:hypothetical protein CPLU01_08932 [Colletotrichum plurivorum]|uniref:Uncharacterized protein n=1 Tax=Colletotrichum plurivorum TaxID=2175906 RepID=A0A8H6K9U7_9PEZI|nr:hypothetical protein CPLU01_08932 [Colletotrichum plurivorum]
MSAAVTGHYAEAGAEVEELAFAQDKEPVVAQLDFATEVLLQRRVVLAAPSSGVPELAEAGGIDDGVGPAEAVEEIPDIVDFGVEANYECEAQNEYELSGRI